MKFDDILRQIGETGPYQKQVYFLATLPTILVAFETVSTIFILNIPQHRCAIPGFEHDNYHAMDDNHSDLLTRYIPQTNGMWDQCHVYTDIMMTTNNSGFQASNRTGNSSDVVETQTNRSVSKCDSWVFDHSIFESTIATDFAIVCGRSIERATSNMISEVGTLLGVFVSGLLADRFGRKIPLYIAGMALTAGGFGIAFTYSLVSLNICRFILGVARVAVVVCGLVIGMEIVGPSSRVSAGMLLNFMWCIGGLLLLLFAYFIRQWRYLEIALSVPSVGLLAYWWLIPESPRWLASKGKVKELNEIVEKIAASNKTKPLTSDETDQLFETDAKTSLRHVFKSRELCRRIIIVYVNLIVVAMCYYGLTFNVTNLAGDIFLNFFISIVVELVGYIVPFLLLDRVGRRPMYCVSMLLAGASCVLSVVPVFLGAPSWVVVAMSMVGRLSLCTAYSVMYIMKAELFPTVIRASAASTAVTVSRVGSIISPYVADVGILVGGKLKDTLPLIIMGTPAILAGLMSLWLPETTGTLLPETLEDLDNVSSANLRSCFGPKKANAREVTIQEEPRTLTTTVV